MDDADSSSSDEEEIEADGEKVESPMDIPSASPEDPFAPPISQKRSHLSSSSDSDKDIPPSGQSSLQMVPAQPSTDGWVRVGKKKGKKCRLEVSTHTG